MKTFIQAIPTDTSKEYPVIEVEVGVRIKETDPTVATEDTAKTEVSKLIPLDSQSKPVAVKYYRHICNNHDDRSGKPCRLEEIAAPVKEVAEVVIE